MKSGYSTPLTSLAQGTSVSSGGTTTSSQSTSRVRTVNSLNTQSPYPMMIQKGSLEGPLLDHLTLICTHWGDIQNNDIKVTFLFKLMHTLIALTLISDPAVILGCN